MNKNEIIELDDNSLNSIIKLIETHRQNAYRKVNEELISLYYEIGEFLSTKIASEKWGSKAIDRLAKEIKKKYPTLKGFANRNLYRMIQFYEAYRHNIIVSTLLTQRKRNNPLTYPYTTLTQKSPTRYTRI